MSVSGFSLPRKSPPVGGTSIFRLTWNPQPKGKVRYGNVCRPSSLPLPSSTGRQLSDDGTNQPASMRPTQAELLGATRVAANFGARFLARILVSEDTWLG